MRYVTLQSGCIAVKKGLRRVAIYSPAPSRLLTMKNSVTLLGEACSRPWKTQSQIWARYGAAANFKQRRRVFLHQSPFITADLTSLIVNTRGWARSMAINIV